MVAAMLGSHDQPNTIHFYLCDTPIFRNIWLQIILLYSNAIFMTALVFDTSSTPIGIIGINNQYKVQNNKKSHITLLWG